MSQTSRMITATVPPKSGSTPGMWDSATVTPKLDIPEFSGIYLESVGGTGATNEVDVTLYQDSTVRASLPKMDARAAYGTNSRQGNYTGCNRFTLSNPTTAALIVEIRLNVDTYYVYSPAGSGGGGVASSVIVTKTEGTVTVAGSVAVTGVDFPTTMTVQGKSDGTAIPVSGSVAVTGVDFPTTMTVQGKSDGTAIPVSGSVAVTGVDFPTTMTVESSATSKPIIVEGKAATPGVTVIPVQVEGKTLGNPVVITGSPGSAAVTVAGSVDSIPVPVTGSTKGNNLPITIQGKSGADAVPVSGTVSTEFADDAAVAIKGVPTVKLQSGTIDVNPTPPPSLSTAILAAVGTTTGVIVNVRAKRASILLQAQISNTAPITVKATDKSNICHLSPGGSMGVEYSGQLWAISTAAGQGIFVTEFYNP